MLGDKAIQSPVARLVAASPDAGRDLVKLLKNDEHWGALQSSIIDILYLIT
jgi:hypothetical protein